MTSTVPRWHMASRGTGPRVSERRTSRDAAVVRRLLHFGVVAHDDRMCDNRRAGVDAFIRVRTGRMLGRRCCTRWLPFARALQRPIQCHRAGWRHPTLWRQRAALPTARKVVHTPSKPPYGRAAIAYFLLVPAQLLAIVVPTVAGIDPSHGSGSSHIAGKEVMIHVQAALSVNKGAGLCCGGAAWL